MNKHLSKEELEEDLLVTYYYQVVNTLKENATAFIGGAIAVVVLVAALVGYSFYSDSQENKAQVLLSTAHVYLMNGNYESALSGSEIEYTLGFEQIIEQYSGTKAGNLAYYYAAVCEQNLGNTESALSYIKKFDTPKGVMGLGPIVFYATLELEAGNTESAASLFEKAANWVPSDVNTPEYLFKAAELYHLANNSSKSTSLVNSILDKYPNSAVITKVKRLQGTI